MLKVLLSMSLVTLDVLPTRATVDGLTRSFTIRLNELSTLNEGVNNSQIRENLTQTTQKIIELERESQVLRTGEDASTTTQCKKNSHF